MGIFIAGAGDPYPRLFGAPRLCQLWHLQATQRTSQEVRQGTVTKYLNELLVTGNIFHILKFQFGK
jgi:hypothetical protein